MTEETQASPEQIAADTEAGFAAGFNESRGTPAPAPAPATAEEKTATTTATPEAPSPEPTLDAKATEDPPWKADLAAVQAKLGSIDELSKSLRVINGHIGNLTSQTKELRSALATANATTEAKGETAPSTQQVAIALKDPERMKRLKEDYPDWAEAFEGELGAIYTRIDELAKKAAPPVDASAIETRITGDVGKRIEAATKTVRQEARALAYLDVKHGEGWETQIATKDFEDWIAKQPKDVQALSASDKASDASRMLDLYAVHRKKAAEQGERNKRLERAVTPSGVAVTAAHEDAEAAFEAAFKAERGG